jgi:hypothetical protein
LNTGQAIRDLETSLRGKQEKRVADLMADLGIFIKKMWDSAKALNG